MGPSSIIASEDLVSLDFRRARRQAVRLSGMPSRETGMYKQYGYKVTTLRRQLV